MPEPMRTCVGCRTTGSKRELVRVVCDTSGDVVIDPSGRAPGRGAYVHATAGCIDEALRRGAFARALGAGLDREGAVRLRTDLGQHVERLGRSTETGRQAGTT